MPGIIDPETSSINNSHLKIIQFFKKDITVQKPLKPLRFE